MGEVREGVQIGAADDDNKKGRGWPEEKGRKAARE